MSQINNNSNSYNIKTAIFADCLANSKEIFQLIDEVFPIDSCRHYQVLPLKLVDNNLSLGMIDPLNEESLKFVNSIARVFQYNLEIQLIDEQTFQIILGNYPQNKPQSQPSGDRNQTVVDDNFNPNTASRSSNSRRLSDSAQTVVSESIPAPKSNSQIPELPKDLDLFKESNSIQSAPTSVRKTCEPKPKKDLAATLFEIPPEFLQQKPQPRNLDDCPTIIGEDPAKLLAQVETSNDDAEAEAKISELINEIDDLDFDVRSKDFLPELLSDLSWQKLLEQAFKHQTEQINLTRYSDRAKIVALHDKLPQSTLEQVPLPIFCSLTNKIEQVAKLSDPLTTPQKVVLEKFHEQERILLRLEFVSPKPEEKIKIQILRGHTLRVYEQQQMDRVSDRALQLAKQLEKTLRRIQVCFDSAELNNLKELQGVQSRINHQLRLLDK